MIPQSVALTSIVVAYGVVLGAIFIFVWLTISRQKRLEKKLKDLQQDLRDSSRK